MALTVKADVVNIGNDSPQASDAFVVDTNVWYHLAYSRASQERTYKARVYPRYVNRSIQAKAGIFRCGLSFPELAHIIEKSERDIWIRKNGDIAEKDYRNRPDERKVVVQEVEGAWSVVEALSKHLDLSVDGPLVNSAVCRFKASPLDGYDLYILEAISRASILQIITDDSDFAAVPGIRVFTCNNSVLEAAREQGKLLRR
mgnify:CR=1 FL=1